MEEELIELLLEGLGVEQIANRLNANEQEVKDKLSEILRDLGLHSLVELRFLALSLPGDATKKKSSQILKMLSGRGDIP